MISLEQIRLLEGKISRAIELIRVLKEENSSLRKGVDSAQKRVKELEALVDGFKTDQREIESVIVRTLKNLDDIEEQIHSGGAAGASQSPAAGQGLAAMPEPPKASAPAAHKADRAAAAPPRPTATAAEKPAAPAAEKPVQPPQEKAAPVSDKAAAVKAPPQTVEAAVGESSKGELDIF